MKTLGLIGGMSWESTLTYYQVINRRVREVKGGLHSAKCIIYSFDFAEIEELQRNGDWSEASTRLDEAAIKLKAAGADALVLCTNTMHFCCNNMENDTSLPMIHIADPTAEQIKKAGFKTVGLLGTRFTMEKDFYKRRLTEKFGLNVLVPDEKGREIVHQIIYEELCNGIVLEASREAYDNIIQDLIRAGAECLILGCTEIGLLIEESVVYVDDTGLSLPVFDTTKIHAVAAADWAMRE